MGVRRFFRISKKNILMARLKKIKDIDTFKPKLESVYQSQKSNREKALEVAKNTPEELKKPIKYLLK